MKKKYFKLIFAAILSLGVMASVSMNAKPAVTQASSYVQISKKGYYFWRDLSFISKTNRTGDADVYKHTYEVAGTTKKKGNTYYTLYRDNFKGYVNAKAVKHVSNMHGNRVSMNRYVRITNDNTTVFDSAWLPNFSTHDKGMSHTFQVKGVYYAANDNDYYSLYNGSKWFGYIKVDCTQTVSAAKGIALNPYKKYVKITSSKANVWGNFSWNKIKHYSKNYMNHTYQVKKLYYHSNGSTYYSLYNGNTWFGYINANSVKNVKYSWGDIIVPSTKFVKIKTSGQTVWGDFNWHQKRHSSSYYVNHTYQVKGIYYHSNGSKYYSLYNGNKWFGYLNAKFTSPVKSAAGDKIAASGYVTPNSKNYAIWSSFAFTHKNGTTSQYRGQKLRVTLKYYHGNGNVFLSVYKGSKWLGYINAAGLSNVK